MLKLNRFRNSIVNLSNVENVKSYCDKITFNTFVKFDERMLNVNACISFDYDYGYTITSNITNGSNSKDRKFAKEFITSLVEKTLA